MEISDVRGFNGKFYFSGQAEIWQSCKVEKNYNMPSNMITEIWLEAYTFDATSMDKPFFRKKVVDNRCN